VKRIQDRFGIRVHPRSTERSLLRHKKTALNGTSHTSASHQDLAVHYEQLRHDAMSRSFSGGRGLGLALFLRSGMTAWMQAWSECAVKVEPETNCVFGRHEVVPVDMRWQLTSLLAGIILSLHQEATTQSTPHTVALGLARGAHYRHR